MRISDPSRYAPASASGGVSYDKAAIVYIDIVTMRGEVPRVADHLLPNEAATLAQDCQFDRGTLAPLAADSPLNITLPITPVTLLHYTDAHWFAWDRKVEVIRSPIAQDPYRRVYWTDGDYPKLTDNTIATTGMHQPTAWYRLGIPAPDVGPTLLSLTVPAGQTDETATDDETRYYVETYVSGWGEEGAPGPASAKITLPVPGTTLRIGLSPAPTSDSHLTHRHLYRSVTGGGAADFRRVAVLPLSTTNFTDTLQADALGPALETYGYSMPPADLRGLCQMANGICAGFAGNAVYFCEPYLPYAWPEKYRTTTEHDIVAVAAMDTALVVATQGYPYVIQGASPSSMTAQKLSHLQQACISASSMVTLDGLALYASADGLVGIGGDGGSVVTDSLITREQWQAMTPATLRAWYHEGKYIGMTDTHAFVFDPKSGDFRQLTHRWDAAYLDMERDALVMAKGTQLYQWQGASTPLPMLWRSKVFPVPAGIRLSCARVVSRQLAQIGFSLMVDGVTVMTLPIGSVPPGCFRLPALRGWGWQVEVQGAGEVQRITLGSSVAQVSAL